MLSGRHNRPRTYGRRAQLRTSDSAAKDQRVGAEIESTTDLLSRKPLRESVEAITVQLEEDVSLYVKTTVNQWPGLSSKLDQLRRATTRKTAADGHSIHAVGVA